MGFLASINSLRHQVVLLHEKYHMLFSLYEACDTWGKQYLELWEPQICALEDVAVEGIGDDTIDEIFSTVSAAIGDTVWEKFGEYIERQHLGEELGVSYELLDMIKQKRTLQAAMGGASG